MEFLDEDSRPRFVLQSKQTNSDPVTQARPLIRPGTFISISLSLILFTLSFFYFTAEPFNSLFLWLSLSLLVGPFAPLSSTAGDIRVGLGSPLQDPVKDDLSDHESDSRKPPNRRSNRPIKKTVEFGPGPANFDPDASPEKINGSVGNLEEINGSAGNLEKNNGSAVNLEKNVWTEGDVELLRKMMMKNPVGKPGRWEAITEGFKGRFRVDNVIKKAKELGEKKISDEDSYQKFLKDRKVVDKKIDGGNEGGFGNVEAKSGGWSSGEDLALLNALKTFPKDAVMRWEKIAAAVPGKSKAACMKRMAELKKDFRSSKSGNAEA